MFVRVALLPAILIPAEEEASLLEELSKAVKRYEPLWSSSEFFRMKPSPGWPIPWLALWWSLALRTWRFVPSPLMAPPHAGSLRSLHVRVAREGVEEGA